MNKYQILSNIMDVIIILFIPVMQLLLFLIFNKFDLISFIVCTGYLIWLIYLITNRYLDDLDENIIIEALGDQD